MTTLPDYHDNPTALANTLRLLATQPFQEYPSAIALHMSQAAALIDYLAAPKPNPTSPPPMFWPQTPTRFVRIDLERTRREGREVVVQD